MRGEARTEIKASPEQLWGMVTDVTRMGEWSPETRRAEWLDGASGPSVGARFRGHNKMGPMTWSTVATITAAEPGREFGFSIDSGGTVWRYRFEPSANGTLVTESYEAPSGSRLARVLLALFRRQRQMVTGMERTLARLKAVAESEPAGKD
jgi:uncharacterized protein YndB with AHSA1/START domain